MAELSVIEDQMVNEYTSKFIRYFNTEMFSTTKKIAKEYNLGLEIMGNIIKNFCTFYADGDIQINCDSDCRKYLHDIFDTTVIKKYRESIKKTHELVNIQADELNKQGAAMVGMDIEIVSLKEKIGELEKNKANKTGRKKENK